MQTVVSKLERCPVCEVAKPRDQFPARNDRPKGIMSRCYECDAKRCRDDYARTGGAAAKARYQANRAQILTRYHSDRQRAIAVYGGRCEGCGDVHRLEFDHPGWDGGEHRKVESHKAMYRRIAELGERLTDRRLRLLCVPCHKLRRLSGRGLLMLLLAGANDWPALELYR